MFLLEQFLIFLIVAVKRSDTFRSQTLQKPEMSMSMAEQSERVNISFCGDAIRASRVLFCIVTPLLQKALQEKGSEDPFYSFVPPLGKHQAFPFSSKFKLSLSLQISKKALLRCFT
jgi:hypothetical protein